LALSAAINMLKKGKQRGKGAVKKIGALLML